MKKLAQKTVASTVNEATTNEDEIISLEYKENNKWRSHAEDGCALLVIGFLEKYLIAIERDNEFLSAERLWKRVKGDKTLREVCKLCESAGVNSKDLCNEFLMFVRDMKCIKYPFYLNFDNVSYSFKQKIDKDDCILFCFNRFEHSSRKFQFTHQLKVLKGGV